MSRRQAVPRRNLMVVVLAGALAGAALVAAGGRGPASGPPAQVAPHAPGRVPAGWTAAAPRDEIRPAFAYDPVGGPDGTGGLVIQADHRDGLDGWWAKSFPVTGGKHYRFAARYRAAGVAVPRRSIVAELHWRDARGRSVPLDEPAVTGYLPGTTPLAETEFPTTRGAD